MDFVLLLFFLYIALCCKPSSQEALSSRAVLPVRGLCAVGVIFSHLTKNAPCEATLLFKYFDFTGAIFVAVFFAISGYALSAQYAAKGSAYLKGFLPKRLASLFVPYGVYLLLFFALRMALGMGFPGLYALLPTDAGLVKYSWYVCAITWVYILYFLSHTLSRGEPRGFAAGIAAGLVLYALLCRLLGFGEWWYNAIIAFPFGMVYFRLHRSGRLGKPIPSLILALGVFGAALVLRLKVFTAGIPGIAADCIISLVFPLALFSFLRRFSLRSRVLDYLGSRSYELYLAQGIPITVLQSGAVKSDSPLLVSGFTLICSLVIAEAVYRLDRKLLGK